MKVEEQLQENSQEGRLAELIDTHLQVAGLIEMPMPDKDGIINTGKQAKFKTLPEYIRHIESEVKDDIRSLEIKALEQNSHFKKEQER